MRNEEEMVGGISKQVHQAKSRAHPKSLLRNRPWRGVGGGGFCSSQYKPCNSEFFCCVRMCSRAMSNMLFTKVEGNIFQFKNI